MKLLPTIHPSSYGSLLKTSALRDMPYAKGKQFTPGKAPLCLPCLFSLRRGVPHLRVRLQVSMHLKLGSLPDHDPREVGNTKAKLVR
jgi:hypothetical protein